MHPGQELLAMETHCKLLKQYLQGFYGANNQGKYIMTENNTPKQLNSTVKPAPKRPNETGSISVQGFVRIFDPATKQVYVEKRA
jgi:hypothetical protein